MQNRCFHLSPLPQSPQGELEPASFSWTYEEIKEVHKRWWQLRDNAVEIFLTNGRTLLLALDSTTVGELPRGRRASSPWHRALLMALTSN